MDDAEWAKVREEVERGIAEAKERWRQGFYQRVRFMERWLKDVPEDNVPTPRGIGDDD